MMRKTAPRPQQLGLPQLRELFALLQQLNREQLRDRFPAWRDPIHRSRA